jgi:hypothetical protein
MKDREDKSMGIVTHIVEVWARIKPTASLRLPKREARKKREKQPCKVLIDATRSAYGDRQEHNGIRTIHVYLTIKPNLHSDFLVEETIRLRSTGGGYSVCERSVCMLSGKSIAVMSHCDIHHECTRRDPIIFSVCQDDIILDLDVTPFIVVYYESIKRELKIFIASRSSYSMGFNSVTNRA